MSSVKSSASKTKKPTSKTSAPTNNVFVGVNKVWWVPDDTQVWALANQTSAELPNGLINFEIISNGKTVSHPSHRCLAATNHVSSNANPEDLVLLPDVNQASILACTRERFNNKKIYTSMGVVLMVVNPFEFIDGLYGEEVISRYINPHKKGLSSHVYMVPSRAYENMCKTGMSQSILISGESGAGKTEATKQCLSFLTHVADAAKKPTNNRMSRIFETLPQEGEIADRIIAASPILEAFGNAQTSRNPNSSRFGKWMVLNFDESNLIRSSSIISYLLEKSRVTQRDSKERNYHIFYQILKGVAPSELKRLNILPDVQLYRYLQSPQQPQDLNDSRGYSHTYESFIKMGFPHEEVMQIIRIISAILLVGNISFIPIEDGEASEVASLEQLNHVATALHVDPLILKYALCNRSIESGKRSKSMITIKLNTAKAVDGRDSLARALYDKLFIDIVATINRNSHSEDNFDGNMNSRSIGLLDIFGFEIFVENSFEQICINYCNERLQNHFNYVIFTAEKALYASENITCETIEFKDNIDVIRDIEMLFKTLDEEGKIPKGTSDTWFHKLKRGPKSITISYPTKRTNNVFTVKHYAGDVDYNAFNCLEKNIETLSNDLIGAMSASTDPIIHRIFELGNEALPSDVRGSINIPSISGKGNNPQRRTSISIIQNKTICWKFQHQLITLMTMLRSTESHFIRCVKSNNLCEPQNFDSSLVYKQLVYSGVFEVVRIQQSGLPCRIPHHEFLLRYRCLAPNNIKYTIKSAGELISYLKTNSYDLPLAQMGLTMTFYKGQEQRLLEQSRDNLFNITITKLQAFLRRNLMECIYKIFISEFKIFWVNCNAFDLAAAHDNCKVLHHLNDTFKKLLKREVLKRVINEVNSEYSLLQNRVALINEAADALGAHSLDHILSLERIIENSNHLDMNNHHLIKECVVKWSEYKAALIFIENITDDIQIIDLSMNEINAGIDNINKFISVIPEALRVVHKANEHKKIVQYEINNIFHPMEKLFFECSIVYDTRNGSIVFKNTSNKENLNELKQMIIHYQSTRFQCKDASSLYKDCTNFVYILERFIPYNNGSDALQFMKELSPTNNNFIQQLSEIKKWAELQMAPIYFKDFLTIGYIPNTVNGSEQPVEVTQISDLLNLLQLLESKSPIISNLMEAASWVLKLRQTYLDKDWDRLERLSDECVEEREKGVFSEYPDCLIDLCNSQWQTVYHGLLSDALFIISEPIFKSIQMDSESWDCLVVHMSENIEVLESMKSFAEELITPKLFSLIPLLENILRLRSLMFNKDIIYCKTIITSLKNNFQQIYTEYNLTIRINEEISKCELLIRKEEFEIHLNATLDIANIKPYSYTGPNEQPLYTTFCSLEEPIQALTLAIKNFVDLGSSNFNKILQERINLAKFILEGRILLNKSEVDDDNGKWEQCLIEYENKIITACSQKSSNEPNNSNNGGTDDDDTSFCIPYFFIPEYNTTIDEFIRRIVLSGLRKILKEACIHGQVDIDINVDESKLVAQFFQFNRLSLIMQDKIDVLPENLKHLHNFTSSVLTLRKLVLEKQWFNSVDTFGIKSNDDNHNNNTLSFVNEAPIKVMLGQLRTMFHGGGLVISEVHNEIELTWSEFKAKESANNLKNALESISVSIDIETELSYKPQVNLIGIKDALLEATKSKGEYSKKLVIIADKFMAALDIFLIGKIDSISALNKINEIISICKGVDISPVNIEKVLKIVRTHNFLEFLCETIQKKENSNDLFEALQQFQIFIKAVPNKFIPHLKAAYHYSEALSAIENNDWLRIIECSKNLEENYEILSSIIISPDMDKKYEEIFLQLIKTKYLYGYNLAINLKAKDEAMKEEEINSSSPTDLSPLENDRMRLQQMDATKLYGVTQLRSAGYSDSDIISIKTPLKYLWAFKFDPVLLRQNGFTVQKLKSVGYTVKELHQAGFSVSQLRSIDCTVQELLSCGASVEQLKTAGYSEIEIMEENLTHSDHKINTEYDASKLVRMGVALQTLISAGFTPFELRAAGFSASDLRAAGFDDVKRLFEAGYDLQRLKSAGFDVLTLKDSGFSFESLKGVGFNEQCLLDSGFDKELERDSLMELYNSAGGPGWKIRLNWNTSVPISEWYGVTVDQNYNVIAIELCDNNLRGVIPESLWLLSKLKVLRLEYNQLRGTVPLLVLNRIKLNNGKADFSYNSQLEVPLLSTNRKNQFSHLLNMSTDSYDMSSSPSPRTPNRTVSKSLYQLNFDNMGDSNNNEILNISSNGQMLFQNDLVEEEEGHKNEWEDVERSALLDLFNSTNGRHWVHKHNWGNPLKKLRDWYGVTVNHHGQVVKLVLPSNNMVGSIPSSISFLESLREVDFRLNQLHGPIPQSMTELINLKVLYLHSNKLSGEIPFQIGNLSIIGMIDLSNNQLTGRPPDSLNRLKQLKYFNLKSNKIKTSLKDMNQLIPWSKNII